MYIFKSVTFEEVKFKQHFELHAHDHKLYFMYQHFEKITLLSLFIKIINYYDFQIFTLLYNLHIVIDEMSMMTNIMLFAIEQCLKQAQSNVNSFTNV